METNSLNRNETMDVVRRRGQGLPKSVYVTAAIIVIGGLALWAVSSFFQDSGGIQVDRNTIVTDVAKRGLLVRTVNAHGSFQPEHIRVVAATQDGVVDEIFVKAGSVVSSGAVIARMESPSLKAALSNAQSTLAVAQANLLDVRAQARASVITQSSTLADSRANMQESELQARSYEQLHRRGLIANLTYQRAIIDSRKTENQVLNDQAQLAVAGADGQAKIAAAQAQVNEAISQVAVAQAQIDALTLRSMSTGVVQNVAIEPGMSVAKGSEIVRVADTRDLKAVLQVSESEVQEIAVGMPVNISSETGVLIGRVSRIAPTAKNGTVGVDVSFAHALPPSARPDASADGIVQIARVPDAISVARPAGAVDRSTIDMFKLVDGGARAVRISVRLGVGSNDRVQALTGISPGDTLIVSDTSAFRDASSIRLH